jgi:hypothetical protein
VGKRRGRMRIVLLIGIGMVAWGGQPTSAFAECAIGTGVVSSINTQRWGNVTNASGTCYMSWYYGNYGVAYSNTTKWDNPSPCDFAGSRVQSTTGTSGYVINYNSQAWAQATRSGTVLKGAYGAGNYYYPGGTVEACWSERPS